MLKNHQWIALRPFFNGKFPAWRLAHPDWLRRPPKRGLEQVKIPTPL